MTRSLPLSLLLALGLGASFAGTASAAPPADKVERLLDAVVQMMPFGQVFDLLAQDDPSWPFAGVVDKVGAGALACVRGELSTPGYRRYQLPRVTRYAGENPDRVDKDLALLEGGAAPLFGKLVMAGAEGERTGVEVDAEQALAGATPQQMEAFMAVFSDPANAGLRDLAGFGSALSLQKTEEENQAAGEKVGGDLAGMLVKRALDTCGVDPDKLQ